LKLRVENPFNFGVRELNLKLHFLSWSTKKGNFGHGLGERQIEFCGHGASIAAELNFLLSLIVSHGNALVVFFLATQLQKEGIRSLASAIFEQISQS
jgi:hypothetical protein